MSDLPMMVRESLGRMTPQQQHMFQDEYRKKMRSTAVMYLVLFLFPVAYFFMLRKVALGFIFIVSGMGFFVWWFVELFLAPGRTREFNGEVATGIVRDLKILGQ